MLKYKIYAAGHFVDTPRTLEVRRPYDNQVFAVTGIADTSLLVETIKKAKSAEPAMKAMSAFNRSLILDKIRRGMEENKDKLARTLCQETGKPLRFAFAEVERAIQVFKIASEEALRLPGEYISIDWTKAGEGKEGIIRYFPVGLVGAISPFNFPLNLSAHKLAPAIASGNPIILKPASQTPVTVLELAAIIDQSGLPEGAVSILPMTRETGNLLVSNPDVCYLTFTGSPEVGWKLKEQCGKKKVVLELGGNAGVLVSDSANLDIAVQKCVTGGYSFSGQVCIHVQRIYVMENVFDEFSSRFKQSVSELIVGDPMDPSTDISVMIDEANACRVGDWIDEAVAEGAEILLGGRRKESFFEPTIITGTMPGMKVCDQEVFGPVVCLEKISSFAEGIEKINHSEYGLQAGVFTNLISEMNLAFEQLEVGGVIINDVPTFRVDHMPYGGIKGSGSGREGVKYAIFDMLEPKLLVKNKN